jgi:CubicO group peptidase (beta-lactamase class C family)
MHPITASALPRTSAATSGVAAGGVMAFFDALRERSLEVHSFMLVRDGRVAVEAWWWPYGPERVHMLHSATKSFASCGVGLAVAEGLLSVEDRVAPLLAEYIEGEPGPHLQELTVKHLLTMTTGQREPVSGAQWRGREESWLRLFFKIPILDRPGTVVRYSSAPSYALSAIVQKVAGMPLEQYMRPRFFEPLGIEPYHWDISPEGINPAGNGLSMRTEDLAKLGVLLLQGGRWNDRQVLLESWVREATANQAPLALPPADASPVRPAVRGEDRRQGYGYHIWRGRHDSFHANGIFEQYCLVIPNRNTVIAVTSGVSLDRTGDVLDLVWEHLLPALDSNAGHSEAASQLEARLAAAATPWAVEMTSSPLASQVSGTEFVEAGSETPVTVSFNFAGPICAFVLKDERGRHEIECGLGSWIEGRTSMTGHQLHHGYQPEITPVIGSGTWMDPHTFVMSWRFVESAFHDTVVCRFEADGGAVYLDRSVNVNSGPLALPTLRCVRAAGGNGKAL